MLHDSKILVTGAAGFIGFHLVHKLLNEGYNVIGIDNLNSYYDVNLKYDRLSQLGVNSSEAAEYNKRVGSKIHENFQFIRLDLEDREQLPKLFKTWNFKLVCNLAAQAGVRYSIENPESYIDSNIVGFLNLLECCRHHEIEHLLYASSSSVYGENANTPFKTEEKADKPVSLYAATKKSNELMAYTYSHLYDLKVTGLRFFTVYGPWGRPDMAMHLFTSAIIKREPIKIFNNGNLERDFTYIDDIIDGVFTILKEEKTFGKKYSLYNIGNSSPVKLLTFIEQIEQNLGIKAIRKMLPMQPGDVSKTWADVTPLQEDFNYIPKTPIEVGISKYVDWHKAYYIQ